MLVKGGNKGYIIQEIICYLLWRILQKILDLNPGSGYMIITEDFFRK